MNVNTPCVSHQQRSGTALPQFVAAGAGDSLAVAWPAHQAGDLALLTVESPAGVATPSG